jgi:SAM domain (Sterile alpha motif)
MDVASWLRSLGLEQYEATFRDNAIDDGVLPDLTDQDLEKLGVLLGHRRKLLRAIANLETTTQSAAAASAAVDASPRDTAERRQVTVMFSDLVAAQSQRHTSVGTRPNPAKGGWCSFRGSRGSANRALLRRSQRRSRTGVGCDRACAARQRVQAPLGDINIVERNQLDTAAFDSLLDIGDGVSFVDDERSAPSSA